MVARTIRFRQQALDRLKEIPERQQGETVRNALDAWFEGGIALWRRRFEQERAARMRAEAQLLRIRSAVAELRGLERLSMAVGAKMPPNFGEQIEASEEENRLAS